MTTLEGLAGHQGILGGNQEKSYILLVRPVPGMTGRKIYVWVLSHSVVYSSVKPYGP